MCESSKPEMSVKEVQKLKDEFTAHIENVVNDAVKEFKQHTGIFPDIRVTTEYIDNIIIGERRNRIYKGCDVRFEVTI